MTNNDIFRRLRYVLNYRDKQIVEILKHVNFNTSVKQVYCWLLKDSEEDFIEMQDNELAEFLNGLIIEKRGRRDGPLPVAETDLNNNLILQKLKIAFSWKYEDFIETLLLTGIKFTKTEISAFFRKPGTKQFRWCKDQFLRKLLIGMQKRYRDLEEEL